ncbi:MAG: hypothetical protein PWP23_2463 [Candidatus Sumerlaeota bacterium]|nr:hypothetical protein [Candidatus Sumerlaeota bacterium]
MTPIDTHIDHDDAHAPDEGALEARARRRNRVLLVILVAVVLAMTLLSYPLFNKYWDPALSDQTISH